MIYFRFHFLILQLSITVTVFQQNFSTLSRQWVWEEGLLSDKTQLMICKDSFFLLSGINFRSEHEETGFLAVNDLPSWISVCLIYHTNFPLKFKAEIYPPFYVCWLQVAVSRFPLKSFSMKYHLQRILYQLQYILMNCSIFTKKKCCLSNLSCFFSGVYQLSTFLSWISVTIPDFMNGSECFGNP